MRVICGQENWSFSLSACFSIPLISELQYDVCLHLLSFCLFNLFLWFLPWTGSLSTPTLNSLFCFLSLSVCVFGSLTVRLIDVDEFREIQYFLIVSLSGQQKYWNINNLAPAHFKLVGFNYMCVIESASSHRCRFTTVLSLCITL